MTVPSENTTPWIAVLGLVVMGHVMAKNARRGGPPTVVWNRPPTLPEALTSSFAGPAPELMPTS